MFKNRYITAIMTFAITVCMSMSITFAASGTITGDVVNVRESASPDATVAGQLQKGTKVTVGSSKNGWSKVKYKSLSGWVSNSYIKVSKNYIKVTGDGLNVRSSASTNASVVTTFAKGTVAKVKKTGSDWVKVSIPGGGTGWVSRKYVTFVSGSSSSTSSSSTSSSTSSAKYANAVVDGLNVREKASTNGNIIGNVSKGTSYRVVKSTGNWVQIKLSGTKGWVAKSYVDISSKKVSKSVTSGFPKVGKANTDALNVRKKASANSKLLTVVYKGKQFTITGQNSKGWYSIDYGRISGWVSKDYVKIVKNAKTPAFARKDVYVSVASLYLRKKASTSSKVITNMERNTKLRARESDGDWYKVRLYSTKQEGWVYKDYVSTSKTKVPQVTQTVSTDTSESSSSTSSDSGNPSYDKATGQAIASFALQYVGYPYVYGGASPSSGFDCSGLVYHTMHNFGISIARVASSQAGYGSYVSKSNLKIGDLVFFSNGGGGINHVGIYIGDNSFVHAANSSSGVKTDSLSSAYYSGNYVTARRIT